MDNTALRRIRRIPNSEFSPYGGSFNEIPAAPAPHVCRISTRSTSVGNGMDTRSLCLFCGVGNGATQLDKGEIK